MLCVSFMGILLLFVLLFCFFFFFFFSSRRRHTRCLSDWSSDVCSSDLCYFAGRDRAALGGEGEASRVRVLDEHRRAVSAQRHRRRPKRRATRGRDRKSVV